MFILFEEILEDSKKNQEPIYQLYLPENFRSSIDSQTKEIIKILKKEISKIEIDFLIPPNPYKKILENLDYSNLIKQIKNYSSYSNKNSDFELQENLGILENKIKHINSHIIQEYVDFYKYIKNSN